LDSRVERFLGRLLAGQQSLELGVDDIANLREIAEPDATRVGGRGGTRDLLAGYVRPRILAIVALLLTKLIGGIGDRQVSRELVPVGLDLGAREVSEELGNAVIDLVGVAVKHPERGTADDRILRLLDNVFVVGQRCKTYLEALGAENHAGTRTRRVHVDGAFLGVELGR